jgi:hypothetical protein
MQAMLVSSNGIVDLLVIILGLVVDHVEEAELVDALGGGNDAEPVTELLLLEELLGAGVALAYALPIPYFRNVTYRYFR